MFLLEYLRGRELQAHLAQKLPFLAIAAIFVGVALHFRGGQTAFTGDYLPQLLVPEQFMWYARKALFPSDLGIVYDWPEAPWTFETQAACAAIVGIGAALWAFRKNRLFVFGVLFFFGNLVLHTALASTFLGPYADRYGYLSGLGVWIALLNWIGDRKWFLGVAGVLVLAYGGLAQAQTQHWKSTIDLWTHNLTHERSTFSNGMRGALYYEQGQFAQAERDFKRVDEAPDSRFDPEKYSYLYTALGIMTTDSEPEASLRYFQIAAQWKPHPESFENVAVAAMKLKDYATAEAHYLKIPPEFEPPSFFMNLSSLYFESQQFEKGAAIMDEAIAAGCNDPLCYKMRCFFRIQTQDLPGALADFKQAQQLHDAFSGGTPDPILINLRSMLRL
jgi:tetratricopeptide (TPR) repeat protein